MSGVLNDCDALLQAAAVRILNFRNASIKLETSAPGFHLTSDGVADLSVVTVTADLVGLEGPVSFSAQGATLSNATARSVDVTYAGSAATVTGSVLSGGEQFERSCVIPVLRDGVKGDPGQNGVSPNKNAVAFLYRWSVAVPAKPASSSTFTWSAAANTAYAGGDGWSIAAPTNPGTPGLKLFVASVAISAAAGATSTTVSYASSTVAAWAQNGADGGAGAPGAQSAAALIYQWATTIPAGPVGSPTLTWADGLFGAAPTAWALTPGNSPSPGMTLWLARANVSDVAGAVSTAFNWSSASVMAIGYAGENGTDGTATFVKVSTSGDQVFSRATSAATFAPASITLAAMAYGGTGTYQWQYWTGSAWTNVAGATAATLAVASSAFTGSRVYRVQATIGGNAYFDEMTLLQITGGKDGVNGTSPIVGLLTNESTTLAATSAGAVSDFSPAGGTFRVFEGITDKTGASVTYSVTAQTGCTAAITTAGVYSVSAMSADQASATLQAVYGGVTIQKVLSLSKARAGASVVGPEGVSYVTAYCASTTASTSTAPAATTGKTSVPAVNGGGITGTWTKTVPALTSGQFMYQTDGLYNPATDTVTWSIPYWSSLKVATLSAIVANLGAITGGSIDIGTGTTSWHVDAQGNMWIGAAAFASAPFRVSNTGAVVATNLAVYSGATPMLTSTGLQAGFEAPGTKNIELAPALNAAASRGAAVNDDPAAENDAAWTRDTGLQRLTTGSTAAGSVGKNFFHAPGGGLDRRVYTSRSFPIDAKKVYELSALLYAAAGNNRQILVFIDFYGSNGAHLGDAGWGSPSHSGFSFFGLTPTGVWTRQGARIGAGTSRTIPVAARTAVIGVWFQYGATGSSSVEHDAQDIRLEDVTAVGQITLAADGTLAGAGGGQVTLPGMGQNAYRIVAHGNSLGAPLPATAGFYVNGAHHTGPARSYVLIAINRSNLAIAHRQSYDVYGNGEFAGINGGNTNAAALAQDLNWFAGPNGVGKYILVLWSHDEPMTNRLTSGLDEALYKNGASRAVFGSSRFLVRSAYALIAISGCGEGNGAEAYQGSVANDPNAWIDVSFTVLNGNLTNVSTSHTPRSLQDYNYSGDLDATKGAPTGTMVGGTLAQTVASNAAAGKTANDALPAMNTAIGDRLRKTGNDLLTGPITISTNGSIQVGTAANGTTISPNGIVGTKNSVANYTQTATGDVTMRSVAILGPGDVPILVSGKSLPEQTSGSPNIAPRLSAWTPWPNSSLSWIYLDPDGRPANGEMAILEPGSGYIGRDSPYLPIIGGEWITVSFMCVTNVDGATINTDIYGSNGVGGGVDTAGKTGTVLPNGTALRVTYTEKMPAQVGNVYCRIWKGTTAGQIGIWDVKVSKGKADTPYSEDVITPGNASTFIQSAAIKLAHIDKASIGELSALSATIGTLRTATTGARVEIRDNVIEGFQWNNVRRYRITA